MKFNLVDLTLSLLYKESNLVNLALLVRFPVRFRAKKTFTETFGTSASACGSNLSSTHNTH